MNGGAGYQDDKNSSPFPDLCIGGGSGKAVMKRPPSPVSGHGAEGCILAIFPLHGRCGFCAKQPPVRSLCLYNAGRMLYILGSKRHLPV
jgi:hypothetical protein